MQQKSFIPLVFENITKTDQDDAELGNFELRRTEIIDGQVTGVYLLIQSGAGAKQGKYIEYRNKKTNRSSIFSVGASNFHTHYWFSRKLAGYLALNDGNKRLTYHVSQRDSPTMKYIRTKPLKDQK